MAGDCRVHTYELPIARGGKVMGMLPWLYAKPENVISSIHVLVPGSNECGISWEGFLKIYSPGKTVLHIWVDPKPN